LRRKEILVARHHRFEVIQQAVVYWTPAFDLWRSVKGCPCVIALGAEKGTGSLPKREIG